MSGNGADVLGPSSLVFVYSLQRDLLVGLVLERLVVEVDTLLLYFSIGFDGTHYLPVLTPTEPDQFGGGVPGVKQDVDLAPIRQEFFEFDQHIACQVVFTAIMQAVVFGTFTVEMTDFLLTQVQPRVKQKTERPDLGM